MSTARQGARPLSPQAQAALARLSASVEAAVLLIMEDEAQQAAPADGRQAPSEDGPQAKEAKRRKT
jgi:hypothetical protein